MVCSWLANSWVCARSVSVTLLCDDSWPCSAASSVLSRIVVTVPITLALAGRRPSVQRQNPCPGGDHDVAAVLAGQQEFDDRGIEADTVDAATHRVAADAEQLLRAVVEQRDVALVVHRDHTLTDAVQQRFPMIGQAGDLGDLQPAGVPFDPPRQQPRRQQAQRRAEAEIEQQPLAGAAEQLPHRRIPLADRRDRQHVAVRRQDRHLADQAVHAVDVVVAEPGPALVGPAGPKVHPLADARRVRRHPHGSVRVEDLGQAGARQRHGAVHLRREHLARRTGRR